MKVSSPKTSLRIPETLALEGAILALEQVSHDFVIWSNLSQISGTCADFCSDPLNLLQPSLFVCGRCLPLHAGHVMSSD